MARQRQTVAERLRVVPEPVRESAAPLPSSDPRLVELVRLLARRAARDFIEAEKRESGRNHPD
ncbi:hypothetical protein EQ718_01915 [Paracoccus versutus]|uniref:Uncharacterized protein n=1 Tax=Paracoccus versutus TaxID=34007 RepID=A0AAQ0HGI0_PARVE|nr:hypothetical protein IT40_20575 [Paracoccus versutus]REG45836.1 hypothetical protein ATH84_10183 [Paracoccus versutus]WEJ77716.1 hypothetical protein EQ718_01915 [Paracoccus versutus]